MIIRARLKRLSLRSTERIAQKPEKEKKMSRASRNFLPDRIWHITHRCHKKEFLLKFRRDKRLWLYWALQAKIRYGLIILNFMITSNHIHLLATGHRGGQQAIPRALQLMESRVAQEYNKRKDRQGAFWEDRYHATAIERGDQFVNCLTYIDINMVRAGVVGHPKDWPFCGYDELMRPPVRRTGQLVDTGLLMELVGAKDIGALQTMRSEWIELAIRKGRLQREPIWTESVAVGSEEYLRNIQAELGGRIKVAEIAPVSETTAQSVLRRIRGTYLCTFKGKNEDIRP
jgi:putative transposase